MFGSTRGSGQSRLVNPLATAVRALGILFLIVVVGLAQLLTPPPPGYVPAGTMPKPPSGGAQKKVEYLALEMLGTWQFYLLWFMFACGAGAGLMIISNMANITTDQAGLKLGFALVAVLAIGNGAGRVMAGMLSDKIGRKWTMLLCFLMQAGLIIALSQATTDTPLASAAVLSVIAALIGANYGANLALFPSVTKDYYGLRNFGVNYGLVFTAWGVGGFMLSLLAGRVHDETQSFNFAYYTSAVLLVLAAAAVLILRPPHQEETPQ